MGCLPCRHIFVDTGPDKLENKHADFAFNPLHFLQSSFSAVQPPKRRGWKMDCFCCRCTEAFLPKAFPRLARDAGIVDPSSGCGSKLVCAHVEGQLGWRLDLSSHRLLPAARAHPGIRWIPKFFYTEPWYIEHARNHPSPGLPCLGIGSPFHLSILVNSSFYHFFVSPTLKQFRFCCQLYPLIRFLLICIQHFPFLPIDKEVSGKYLIVNTTFDYSK